MLFLNEKNEGSPKIKVIGIGGGGGNAVGRMFCQGFDDIEFALINTDHQALMNSSVKEKIQIGQSITKGQGSGGNVEIGQQSAEADEDMIHDILEGVDILFITACFGGGTGTGASPVVAKIAREMNILTFAIITKPFLFEGTKREQAARQGLKLLHEEVEAIVPLPNDNLIEHADENTSIMDAFCIVDDFLASSVRTVHRLITKPGLINLDFADVRAVMKEKGSACIGHGAAEGKAKTLRAFEMALNSPLLDKHGVEGARGILISIMGGKDLTLREIHSSITKIKQSADKDANIIFGATIDDTYDDRVEVTLIATGITPEDNSNKFISEIQSSKINAQKNTQVQSQIDFSHPERGHFDEIEPTFHEGEDLDIPTYLRKKPR
ncbi:MAG: cell division protein FtsZ [Candidatus Theseobacter exili]|nr:cell division protein FtsZ [Candidatus Theseobacter exili]